MHFKVELFIHCGYLFNAYAEIWMLLAYLLSVLDFIQGSFNSTGLTVSSKLPRFSDMYTLTVASADPKSISANKTVEFTKSVTKWLVFTFI